MLWLVGISLLVGVLLALLQFKVLILVPAHVIGMAILAGTGIAFGRSVSAIVLAMVFCGVAVQIGYLAGAVGAGLAAHQRNSRGRSLGLPAVPHDVGSP